MATKSNNNGVLAAEIGAGVLAAAAAAGTGYYFYASDEAKKHRKIASKWADGMRKEIIKQAKVARAVSPAQFARIADEAALAYAAARNIRREDVMGAANELKMHYDKIRAQIETAGKSGARKAVRKSKAVVKKAKKKVPKKVKKARA